VKLLKLEEAQKAFTAITLATFFAMFGDTVPQSFQPLFIAGLGVTPAVVALIYNIKNVTQTLLRPVSGALSDSIGRKNMMLFGMALFAITPFIYSVAQTPTMPVLAMFVSGLALSVYFPPSEAYASSLYPSDRAGEAMGRYHMSWAVSAVIGPAAGGYLVRFFPNYRPLFVVSGLITALGFLLIGRYMEDDRDASCPMKPGVQVQMVLSEFPSNMRRLLGNRKVIAASTAVFAHAFCHWGLVTFIPLLGAAMGMNELMIGLTLTANAVVIAVSLPIVGSLSDRVGRFTPIAVGLLLSVAAFVFIPLAPYHWILPVLNAVLGLCAVLVFPISQAATMEAIPPGDRGSATGVWGMIMSLGGTVGMFTMSGVLYVASIEWVFYACAAVTLAFSLVIVSMRGYFD
jgi:DHA1 family multidrug resistance protein-like MFS transporter